MSRGYFAANIPICKNRNRRQAIDATYVTLLPIGEYSLFGLDRHVSLKSNAGLILSTRRILIASEPVDSWTQYIVVIINIRIQGKKKFRQWTSMCQQFHYKHFRAAYPASKLHNLYTLIHWRCRGLGTKRLHARHPVERRPL